MSKYLYSGFTAVKIPFHLSFPERKVENIQDGIAYLESVGGGFLHARARIDEGTSCTASLDLGVIWGKSDEAVLSLLDAAVDAQLERLKQVPPAYRQLPG